MKIFFSVIASIIAIWAFLPYLRDIYRGNTKPHAYSWLIWSITQGTAMAALLYGGGDWGGLALTIGTLFVFSIFLYSLKNGTKNITKSDTLILIAALAAVVVWWQTNTPLYSVIMVTVIDVVGFYPTLRKTYLDPWSETPSAWAGFVMSNIFSILALNEYNILTLTYIIGITLANGAIWLAVVARRPLVKKVSTHS